MNIKDTLSWAIAELIKADNYLADPRVDAEILLSDVLGKDRSYLHTWPERELDKEQTNIFKSYILSRVNGKPIAYILGYKEFWDLKLTVTKDVLIPRSETEILVEYILQNFTNNKQVRLLDLGTGSGAIALALAKHRANWQITAMDKSEAALLVAKNNAKKLKINNIEFTLNSWSNNLEACGKFDIVISNPPYIAENDSHLLKGDIVCEPRGALVSGLAGLDDIKKIITNAKKILNSRGCLILEHGYEQNKEICSILEDNNFLDICSLRDLSGHNRAIVGFF